MAEQDFSCNIRLYRYNGEPNRRVKGGMLTNLDGTVIGTTGDYISGTFRTPLDFVHPTFFIESDRGFSWNYLRLENTVGGFNVTYRYYFVTKVICLNHNMYEVQCVEDVLSTFSSIINNYGYGFVDRNEFNYNDYIPDNNRVIELGQTVTDDVINNSILNSETDGVWLISGMGLRAWRRENE